MLRCCNIDLTANTPTYPPMWRFSRPDRQHGSAWGRLEYLFLPAMWRFSGTDGMPVRRAVRIPGTDRTPFSGEVRMQVSGAVRVSSRRGHDMAVIIAERRANSAVQRRNTAVVGLSPRNVAKVATSPPPRTANLASGTHLTDRPASHRAARAPLSRDRTALLMSGDSI